MLTVLQSVLGSFSFVNGKVRVASPRIPRRASKLQELLGNKLLFKPTKKIYVPDSDLNLLSEVIISKPDGKRLHGYFLKADPYTKKTYVYLHGYKGNVTKYLNDCKIIQEQVNANVLIFDYRGYGKSDGKPTTQGVIDDTKFVYDWLVNNGTPSVGPVGSDDIVFIGRSLGAAISLEAAQDAHVHSIGLISPFTSLREAATCRYPWLPTFWIPVGIFNCRELIQNAQTDRVSVFHSVEDELIPLSQGKELFELTPHEKKGKFREVSDADHSNIFSKFTSADFVALRELAA